MNENGPVKTVVTKKVVTTMPTGMAKPIPVNSVDAVNIAREQEQLRKMAEEQARLEEQAMAQMQNVNNLEGTVIPNNQEAIQNVDNSVAQFNEVNDLVKVVEQKNNPKLIAVMAIILLIIVVIIIIQIPMLFNL